MPAAPGPSAACRKGTTMSDDRPPDAFGPPAAYEPAGVDVLPATDVLPGVGGDLVPGMVTVLEPVGGPAAMLSEAAAQEDGFDLVLRGYDRHQVDRHMDRVGALVEQMHAQLMESTSREAAAMAELARVSAELERGRPTFDALGDRVGQMLALAETEATQMRTDAEQDAAALRGAAEREAADTRSDARRDAEELGRAARHEVAELGEQRVTLLTEIATMRDTLNSILAATSEQWPSLAPTDQPLPVEGDAVPSDALDQDTDPDQTETTRIDLTEEASRRQT